MDEELYVCAECVCEPYLSGEIVSLGVCRECSYCNAEEAAITVEELADHIEGAFERHYYRTSDQPNSFEWVMMSDKELSYDFERHGEPILEAIGGAAQIEEEIASEVLNILSERHSDFEMAQMGDECEFDPDSHYEWKRPSDYEFQFGWNEVEASLKKRSRFFNDEAVAFLTGLFADLESKITEAGEAVIKNAGPDHQMKSFYRGRVFSFGDDIEKALARPDIELAGPPSHLARAGRMNAHGISVFYGATEPEVALAEIRPAVGSAVLVGKFELIENMRLLDLAALSSVLAEGSVFDAQYLERLEQAKFLRSFARRMTMPVMPDDEPTEYLTTQLVADFLAQKADTVLHGILYESVQVGKDGQNVALFHAASKVKQLDFPEGTEIRAHFYYGAEEGPEIDYTVHEKVPPEDNSKEEQSNSFELPWGSETLVIDHDADARHPKLRVDLESLEVRHVDGVNFETQNHGVRRSRSIKRERKF